MLVHELATCTTSSTMLVHELATCSTSSTTLVLLELLSEVECLIEY